LSPSLLHWQEDTILLLRTLLAVATLAVAGLPVSAQSNNQPQWVFLRYDFSEGSSGWLSSFSDYSLQIADLERIAEIRFLPHEIDANERGYYLQSTNRADDVFMFLKKSLGTKDGLVANQAYDVWIYVELASDAPSNCVGIGGAPGESVYLKAGVSLVEPVPMLEGNNVRLNVDKGNQAGGGADASVIGNIVNGLPCEEAMGRSVLLKRFHRHPTPVTTGLSGDLWVFLGTDSGFEGTTGLHYSLIQILLTPAASGTGSGGVRTPPVQ
jgi:hypothetical protein